VRTYGSDAVVKIPFPSTPDRWIRDEAVYTAAVYAVGAPAPRLLDVVEREGRTVSIFERVVGPSMWQYIRQHPDEIAAMGTLLGELHAHIVALTPPPTLPRQYDRLACKIRRAAGAVADELLDALALLPQPNQRTRLCHGDLHPGNVIMSATGPVIVDWFDACLGDPAGDVARSSLLMGAGGATAESVAHLPGARHDELATLHQAYLDEAMRTLDIDHDSIVTWRRIEAAARLAEGLLAPELLAVWRKLGGLPANSFDDAANPVEDRPRSTDDEVLVLRAGQLGGRPGLGGNQ
jgi:aminoglycoside phosphotransferase (APT) family kinase protein